MQLNKRLELLSVLSKHLQGNNAELQAILHQAEIQNSWFKQEFLTTALRTICERFLSKEQLTILVEQYQLNAIHQQKQIGIVMAGNIPLVGFHDWLCCFLCGYHTTIKLSSKDSILFTHIVDFLCAIEPALKTEIILTTHTLKNCDAYLTMGTNFSTHYFEQYFANKPCIMRKNKTSAAILKGNETPNDLKLLATDAMTYFGLGCRNVTKLFLPKDYDIKNLFPFFEPYRHFLQDHKYKNNYDYQLTILLLNKIPFVTNDFLLFVENEALHVPLSCIYFSYYDNEEELLQRLAISDSLQCIVGANAIPFGTTQTPHFTDYPDNKDIILFLKNL